MSFHLFSSFLTWIAVRLEFMNTTFISGVSLIKSPSSFNLPFVKKLLDDIYRHLTRLLLATDSLKVTSLHSSLDLSCASSARSKMTPPLK